MNIYQIYVTVVQTGSFSAAAKKLHRTPSSISKKMGTLEQRLNVQLFDRTTRNLAITEAGQIYYERCLNIAQQINDAEDELADLSGDPSGTIRLTWPNAISSTSVIETLGEFNQQHPEIKLDIQVTNAHLNLIEEHIDFAIRMNPVIDSSMIAIELFRMAPILCASPEYLERYGTPNQMSDLASLPLLLLNNPSAIQLFWKNLPDMKSLDLSVHNRVDDINALLRMVKNGLGITLLFKHMIEDELAAGTLVACLPEYEFTPQPVYLMFHQNEYVPRKMKLLIDFFKGKYL